MVGLRRRWIVGRGRGASLPFAAITYQGISWSLLVTGVVGLASGQQGVDSCCCINMMSELFHQYVLFVFACYLGGIKGQQTWHRVVSV